MLIAACGAEAPSPVPTTVPTPVVTPNPHLGEPATARDVFNGLGRAGLRITPNTANTGTDDDVVVNRINATYHDWPLDVYEFRTTEDLEAATDAWDPEKGPGRGDPPFSLVGLNILVTWGPRLPGDPPDAPDPLQAEALDALVAALEPLVSPLRGRTVIPVEFASIAAASADPSVKAKATPAP
jgi:hypothetical protein